MTIDARNPGDPDALDAFAARGVKAQRAVDELTAPALDEIEFLHYALSLLLLRDGGSVELRHTGTRYECSLHTRGADRLRSQTTSGVDDTEPLKAMRAALERFARARVSK
jgi:hypothetical protein